MTRDDLTKALDAFVLDYKRFPKQAEYVAGIQRRVETLLALPGVDNLLSADKAALRVVSDAGLEIAQNALRSLNCYTPALDAAPALRAASRALYMEHRRRRTNAARAANEAKRALATTGLAERFPVGTRCQVHAFGYWYTGTVTRHAAKGGKVAVTYTTGTGTTREKLVAGDLIREA